MNFRHSQLLSAARLVASPRSHPLDEAAYAGLVTFVPLEQIAATYRAWVAIPAPRRATQQLEVWEAFRQRFAPPQLFADAGIYEALLQPVDAGLAGRSSRWASYGARKRNKGIRGIH